MKAQSDFWQRAMQKLASEDCSTLENQSSDVWDFVVNVTAFGSLSQILVSQQSFTSGWISLTKLLLTNS